MKKVITFLVFSTVLVVAFLVINDKKPNGEVINSVTETEARSIAEKFCVKGGEAISGGRYDKGSKTWSFEANLNMVAEGCTPSCVVYEESRNAEIAWNCAEGTPPFENKEIVCDEKYRNSSGCTKEYHPVCGLVQVQCIKEPCNPIRQTFGNVCVACSNTLTKSYYEGVCNDQIP